MKSVELFVALGAEKAVVGCPGSGVGPGAIGPVLGVVVAAGGSVAVEGVVFVVGECAVAGWRLGGGGHRGDCCGRNGKG